MHREAPEELDWVRGIEIRIGSETSKVVGEVSVYQIG